MKQQFDKKLEKVAQFVISETKKIGVSQCSVAITKNRSNRVICRDGSWEEIKGSTTMGLKMRIYVDGKYAIHSTSDLNINNLKSFLTEATGLTRYLTADKHRKLPPPQMYKGRSTADLKLYDPSYSSFSLKKRKEIAQKSYEAAKANGGANLISAAAAFSDSSSEYLLVNSNGFSDFDFYTTFVQYAMVSLNDAGAGRPSNYEVTAARFANDLAKPEIIGKKAATRTIARLGAKKIKSGKMDVLVENRAVKTIFRGLLRPLTGKKLYNKQSCFESLVGKEVGSKELVIACNPFIVGGLGSGRFDSEGITAKQFPIITKGKLNNYFIDTYYGSKLGKPVTTGSQFNLTIEPGNKDFQTILKSMKKGLIISQFNGGNSNSTTGDFSHGIKGFMVENGVITGPVKELNISGNHKTFWKKLKLIGSDVYTPSSTRVPSLLFESVMIAGK
jgi:PmbA protein